MYEVLTSPLAWLTLSLVAYELGKLIAARLRTPIANPLLIAALLVGGLLVATGTPLDSYDTGGVFLTLMLTPATAALALPIYRQRETLRRNLVPILAGTAVGSAVSVSSVWLLGRALGLRWESLAALLPKSVTTAIAVPLAESLGGLTSLTAIAVVFTGIIGAVFLPTFLAALGIRDPIARGLAIGTAAHAVGTSRALELGKTEGAMSGLAVGVAGLITSVLISVLRLLL